MGSLIRWHEHRVEKALNRNKSKGVRVAPARGTRPSELVIETDVAGGDTRSGIPALGLREYWYPALPASKVGRKPLYWKMLGEDLVFFRDEKGEVVALTDTCAHRGTSLSEGDCFYRGFVSCSYHGATYNGEGECVAFLCEGPASRMVGNLHARKYPTQTLRGWVFVWMGEGEPAPIEEDAPPELFEPDTMLHSSYTYWSTDWLLAIENHSDSHNAFYVHRNSISQLTSSRAGRDRTPLSPHGRIVNDRAIVTTHPHENPYAVNGQVPYQMYYPGVNGMWPLHRWRRLWLWLFDLFDRRSRVPGQWRRYEEWGIGHHLPCAVRQGGGGTRWAVPVEPNLSRIVYFYFSRPRSGLSKLIDRLRFTFIRIPLVYNFSGQDNTAATPVRYWTLEHLAPTDSQVVLLRKLILERSRDARRRNAGIRSGDNAPSPTPSPEAAPNAVAAD